MANEMRLAELTAFENVLDTFGGDPARWPAERRERFVRLAAADADAARLLHEAKALDAVLTKVGRLPVRDTRALADRIAAAVADTAPGQPAPSQKQAESSPVSGDGGSGVVIAWPRSGETPRAPSQAAVASAPRRLSSGWRTAALLAASLVVGIFVGVADMVPTDVAQMVADATTGTDNTYQALAFLNGEGLLEIIEEDYL
jgi:hypothetical protein